MLLSICLFYLNVCVYANVKYALVCSVHSEYLLPSIFINELYRLGGMSYWNLYYLNNIIFMFGLAFHLLVLQFRKQHQYIEMYKA